MRAFFLIVRVVPKHSYEQMYGTPQKPSMQRKMTLFEFFWSFLHFWGRKCPIFPVWTAKCSAEADLVEKAHLHSWAAPRGPSRLPSCASLVASLVASRASRVPSRSLALPLRFPRVFLACFTIFAQIAPKPKKNCLKCIFF